MYKAQLQRERESEREGKRKQTLTLLVNYTTICRLHNSFKGRERLNELNFHMMEN